MLVSEVEACAFDQWYATFTKVTFESRILLLPKPVLAYLRSDAGIILPVECDQDNSHEEECWGGETTNGTNDTEEQDSLPRPSFPDFACSVRTAILELGGAVMPKLNWSAPRDASWMGLANSLKCTTLSQIFLLLKSSDFVAHDLTQPYKDCDDHDKTKKDDSYVLVLRRWSDHIHPGNEYRCFVKNRRLIAVSQRDNTQHYNHIKEEKESIKRDIQTFFDEQISSKLDSEPQRESDCVGEKLRSLSDIVFDIVRLRKDHVRLVDINPFGPTTDSLLFEWDELADINAVDSRNANNIFEFRFIENDAGIQPNGLRHYSIPKDFVDLATGSDPHKLVDFLQLQQQITSKETDSIDSN